MSSSQLRRIRHNLWENHSWLLHHDNAPAHTALSVRQFLASKQVTCLEHPPCLPDLAPCDFWLFPRMKAVLKGTHFASVEEIKAAVTRQLRDLKEKDFTECFQGWQKQINSVLTPRGITLKGTISYLYLNLKINVWYWVSFLFCHTLYI